MLQICCFYERKKYFLQRNKKGEKKKIEVLENGNKPERCRKWTDNEVELYAIILADEENTFAPSLEKLALKKAVKTKYL